MFRRSKSEQINYDNSSNTENLYKFDKWLSNNKLKLVKITRSFDNFVEYNDSGNITKIKSSDFLNNFKPVDLDMTLYNGIPQSYLGDGPIWF